MSQLARLLGAFAPGHVLEHRGKNYEFHRVDQAMKARLEALYFKRCRETLYGVRSELSEQEFDRLLGRVTDSYSAGEMAFPMGKSLEWFAGEGIAELVEVLAGCTASEALTLSSERWQEVFHLIWCVLCESSSVGGPALKKRLLQAESAGGKQAEAMRVLAAQLALTSGETLSCATTSP